MNDNEIIPYTINYLKLNLPSAVNFRSDKVYDKLLVSFLDKQAIYATVNVYLDKIEVVEKRMDLRGKHLSPSTWLNTSMDKVILVKDNEVVEEYKNTSIISHVFNPHTRIGACILREKRFAGGRTFIVHGFHDNSYNVLKVSEGILGFSPEGVLLAYTDKRRLIVELPPNKGILIETPSREVKGLKEVYLLNDLVFLNHSMGLTVFKDNRVMVHIRNINLIPILVLEDSVVFWDEASGSIVYLKDDSIRYSTLCSSKPHVIKCSSEEVLLACGKSVIQLNIRSGLWRLHSIVKNTLGINYRRISAIGDVFVLDTADGILLMDADGRSKRYYSIKGLLGVDILRNKIVAYTTEAILVIDPSRYYHVNNVVSYEVIEEDDVYPKIRVRVAEGVIVDDIEYPNKLRLIRCNDRELIFTYTSGGNLWITLKPLSLRPLRIELKLPKPNLTVKVKNINIRKSSECGGEAISLRYYYVNPRNEIIRIPVLIDNRIAEHIILEPHSKGLEQIEVCIPDIVRNELLVKLEVDGRNPFKHIVRLRNNRREEKEAHIHVNGFTIIGRRAYLKVSINGRISYDNLLVEGVLESHGKPRIEGDMLLIPIIPGRGHGLTVLLGHNDSRNNMAYNVPVLVHDDVLRIIPTYCVDKHCYAIIDVGKQGYLIVFVDRELIYGGFSGRGNILVRLNLNNSKDIIHAYLYSDEKIYYYHTIIVREDNRVSVDVDFGNNLVYISIHNHGIHNVIASFNNVYYNVDTNNRLVLEYDWDTFMSINTPLSIIGPGFYYDVDVKKLLIRKLLYRAIKSASLISRLLT